MTITVSIIDASLTAYIRHILTTLLAAVIFLENCVTLLEVQLS